MIAIGGAAMPRELLAVSARRGRPASRPRAPHPTGIPDAAPTPAPDQREPGSLRFRNGWLGAGFTDVANVVLLSPRLNPTAKVLYGLLLSYAWETDHAW